MLDFFTRSSTLRFLFPFHKPSPSSSTNPTSPPHPSTSMSTEQDIEKDAISHPPPTTLPIPPSLEKFQTLVGICSPSLLTPGSHRPRPAPNEGIYKRTCEEERRIKWRFSLSTYVVNGSGLAQIIVAAAVTALGAANGPKSAVTVLGAANTIMAGLLTYLKGQGLPTRLDQYHHLLRTLREHIEEREREFLEPGCPLNVDEEIALIAKMYQEVRQTAADNAPGTVLPPQGAITSLLKKPDVPRSEVMAPRGDKKPTDMLMSGLQDLAHFGKEQMHQRGKGVEEEDGREGAVRKAKEAVGEEERRVEGGVERFEEEVEGRIGKGGEGWGGGRV